MLKRLCLLYMRDTGITILLALSVYKLLVADCLPKSSERVPVLSQYFSSLTC